jgi:hypothetical protein
MKRAFLTVAAAVMLVAGAAGSAQAALITPEMGVLNITRWEGDDNSQAAINAIIGPILALSGSVELYKQDRTTSTESGALAGSYSSVLGNNAGTITYDGGVFVGPVAFLLVKDGNASPNWHLFNLTALLGWDGQETLELSGFFLDKDPVRPGNQGGGAISHVTLYGSEAGGGSDGGTVPEPATLALFGAALAMAGAALRRRS